MNKVFSPTLAFIALLLVQVATFVAVILLFQSLFTFYKFQTEIISAQTNSLQNVIDSASKSAAVKVVSPTPVKSQVIVPSKAPVTPEVK